MYILIFHKGQLDKSKVKIKRYEGYTMYAKKVIDAQDSAEALGYTVLILSFALGHWYLRVKDHQRWCLILIQEKFFPIQFSFKSSGYINYKVSV